MGLIGRRCTAVMPSRPVLIGRGLVPTTYMTTHTRACTYSHLLHASTNQFPTNTPPSIQCGEVVSVGTRTHNKTQSQTNSPPTPPHIGGRLMVNRSQELRRP